jgi:indole-3-glycerol phosphate synthase
MSGENISGGCEINGGGSGICHSGIGGDGSISHGGNGGIGSIYSSRDRFSAAIRAANARGHIAVIPDIKCISPKEGDLLRGRDPAEIAKRLVSWGAPVLSVVTEQQRFGGSTELLKEIVHATKIPVLRKDFITNEDMLYGTSELGASAVLLICAILDEQTLGRLYKKALLLGLEPFVEVCSAREMEWANRIRARLIGINNRDIVTLELDDGGPSRTSQLTTALPDGALLVSESGILSARDARLAVSAGANAVLVGTALWKASDMEDMYKLLQVEKTPPGAQIRPKVKICGLKRMSDVRVCIRHGTDILGFVVDYPKPVPWNLTAESAKELITATKTLTDLTNETCIVTGSSLAHTIKLAETIKPDYIQLHNGESLEYTISLVNELRGSGIKIIKALFPDTPDITKTAVGFCEAGVYALLYDPRTPGNAGSGDIADISGFNRLRSAVRRPVALAGGITPDNVASIIRKAKPAIIDLMTGVESSPGIKDESKVIELFRAIRFM